MNTPVPLVLFLAGALATATVGTALDGPTLPTTPGPGAPQAPRPDDIASDPRFEPGLVERSAASNGPLPVLVRFRSETPDPAPPGLTVTYRFASVPALLGVLGPAALDGLAARHDIAYVEAAKAIQPALDSATRASNARDVTDADHNPETPPLFDPTGAPIDGTGVAVAVVDTGIDSTHPGLTGKIAANWVVTPAGVLPGGPFTAQTPHGTHMAGIVAGSGAGSFDRQYRGVAEGATLQGFAVGGSLAFAAVAFDWILQNGAAQEPPIRVVLNAWTCATAACRTWDALQLHNVLASELAEAGFVVVYAAGNDGGSGFASTTSPAATNPTPGIVSVADYNDLDSGLRVTCLYPTSSRGTASDPSTWPDVAAPGRSTMSPHAIEPGAATRVPGLEANAYTLQHGTSAAAAHTAGLVALLLQIRPDLRPTDIEHLLKQTATPLDCGIASVRASPTHPWTPANYAAGHGLVDAYAAALAALAHTHVPTDAPALEPIPEPWLWIRTGAEVDTPSYLTADGRIVAAYPDRDLPTTIAVTGDGVAFESTPFALDAIHSAAVVDLWIGTNWESTATRLVAPRLVLTLDKVDSTGTVVPIAEGRKAGWFVPTLSPIHRPFLLPFDAPVAFAAGDLLRVTVRVAEPVVAAGVATVPPAALLYTDAWHTPSRVALGQVAPTPPATSAHCLARHDCVEVGGDRRIEGLDCASAPFLLRWSGPPGSFLALSCHGSAHTCTVPTGPAWGTCERVVVVEALPSNNKASTCSYWTPDGERAAGSGVCAALVPVEDED